MHVLHGSPQGFGNLVCVARCPIANSDHNCLSIELLLHGRVFHGVPSQALMLSTVDGSLLGKPGLISPFYCRVRDNDSVVLFISHTV